MAIQKILFPDSPVEWDGIFGPITRAAFDELALPEYIKGDGSWPWIQASIEGSDIVIKPGNVTAFGGADDPIDSGETASGLSTKDNPSFIGCALPMRRDALMQLRGSPIPKLPWRTEVVFVNPATGQSVAAQLIDEGPAKWTGNIGDLTVAAAKAFDPNATATTFKQRLGIRIIGGAKYVT